MKLKYLPNIITFLRFILIVPVFIYLVQREIIPLRFMSSSLRVYPMVWMVYWPDVLVGPANLAL